MSNSSHGVSTLLGSFAFFIIIGAVYNWGIVSDYYSSYLLKNTGNINSFSLSKLGVSFLLLFEYVVMSVNSCITFISLKNCVLVGLLLNLVSYFVLIFGSSVAIFFLAMILIGIGNGVIYLKLINNTWMFFPQYKGQVSGLLLGGLGLSAFLLNPLANYMINPTKVGYDYQMYYLFSIPERTQNYIVFLFFFFSLIGCVGYYNIYDYAEEEIKVPQVESRDKGEEIENPLNLSSVTDGLFTLQFAKLATITFSLAFFSIFLSITYPSYARLKDVDEFLVNLTCVFFPFINGFGRIIWGFLADIFSYKKLLEVVFICQIITIILLLIFNNEIMLFILILLGAVCLSGKVGILPITYNKVFGKRYGVLIFGVGLSTVGISSVITSFLVNLKISLSIIYLIGGAICIAGLFVLRTLEDEKKEEEVKDVNHLEELSRLLLHDKSN